MHTKWDVFISHASEDKDEVARPLADALKARGLAVWYDEFTLLPGQSLRKSIDAGLANSTYGVVILSHAFFDKQWPERELGGLFSKQEAFQRLLIPVWHKVTADQVRDYSPMLADVVALDTNVGIEAVAEKVCDSLDRGKLMATENQLQEFLQQNGELLDHAFNKYAQARDQRERFFVVEHLNQLLGRRRALLKGLRKEPSDEPISKLDGKVVTERSVLRSRVFDDPKRLVEVAVISGQSCDACGAFGVDGQLVEDHAHLCRDCAVEYQCVWRLEHARIDPNVIGYLKWKQKREKESDK